MAAASRRQAAAYLDLLRDFIALPKLLLFTSKRRREDGAAALVGGYQKKLPTHNNGFSIVTGKVDDNMTIVS